MLSQLFKNKKNTKWNSDPITTKKKRRRVTTSIFPANCSLESSM